MQLEHRVLLSGTPLQNNVNELFSLLNFLEPLQFTSQDSFLQVNYLIFILFLFDLLVPSMEPVCFNDTVALHSSSYGVQELQNVLPLSVGGIIIFDEIISHLNVTNAKYGIISFKLSIRSLVNFKPRNKLKSCKHYSNP